MSDGNDYVFGRLEEVLAQTGETDVRVLIEPGQIRITAVASSLVENLDVRNEVTVLSQRQPIGP